MIGACPLSFRLSFWQENKHKQRWPFPPDRPPGYRRSDLRPRNRIRHSTVIPCRIANQDMKRSNGRPKKFGPKSEAFYFIATSK